MMRSSPVSHLLLGLVLAGAAGACVGDVEESLPADEDVAADEQAIHAGNPVAQGKKLFRRETFGGNDRTCSSCHTKKSGTINPEQLQELYEDDPENPVFASIDSDDGVGDSFERLLSTATVRITLPLPPNIRLLDDPGATEVVLHRSVPTVNNVALDPVVMWDGREPTLETQVVGAVHAHYENTVEPTTREAELIAAYERALFSSKELERYADGGPAPELPDGNTAAEKRGREFFNPEGACGSCHSGPMLNTTTEFNPLFLEPGVRFASVSAGFPEALGAPPPENRVNPIRVWNMDCPPEGSFLCSNAELFGAILNDDNTVTLFAPDLGQPLANGHIDDFLFFKIPTVWGIKDTAPYFHDNSAADLEDLMDHYDLVFEFLTGQGFTPQEKSDIIAYMKLL